ncbi:hypothetical protein IMG5_044650 [Ichthyophthirius multifiliis]|uniref:Uncharacterized protein n=1 Tax=Ichthyophthirius multifiliis TaxID=5932 RepID=G0QM56_ICHMU|nr:hypothetical protein IMG5_044650 [Ichthyophthirius multifiliis]EGR33699.1 hypothetical protein IMG5_044650 [Ichthyophthirius multifiliis]|eukprot:XP_004037685.1 hypothetical protein IMG5_044650 [Ichthyophthirius multifiliis]
MKKKKTKQHTNKYNKYQVNKQNKNKTKNKTKKDQIDIKQCLEGENLIQELNNIKVQLNKLSSKFEVLSFEKNKVQQNQQLNSSKSQQRINSQNSQRKDNYKLSKKDINKKPSSAWRTGERSNSLYANNISQSEYVQSVSQVTQLSQMEDCNQKSKNLHQKQHNVYLMYQILHNNFILNQAKKYNQLLGIIQMINICKINKQLIYKLKYRKKILNEEDLIKKDEEKKQKKKKRKYKLKLISTPKQLIMSKYDYFTEISGKYQYVKFIYKYRNKKSCLRRQQKVFRGKKNYKDLIKIGINKQLKENQLK